jgi:hypothetical protein
VLAPLFLSANLPAKATAELYRETAIDINVFRDRHPIAKDCRARRSTRASAKRWPGRERGIASFDRLTDAELSFELRLGAAACLIAKLRLADRVDAASNSCHLHFERGRA